MNRVSTNEMDKATNELADLVLKWAKVDQDVKENGWTSGNEGEWERLRDKMVSKAEEIKNKTLDGNGIIGGRDETIRCH